MISVMNTKYVILLLPAMISSRTSQKSPKANTDANIDGCSYIPNIDHPINMIRFANEYINDGLHAENPYTHVKYVYYKKIASTQIPGQFLYNLVFSITDYYATKYMGIQLLVSPAGIDSARITKYIFTADLAKIRYVIGPDIDDITQKTCGDLKFVYTTSRLNGIVDVAEIYADSSKKYLGLSRLNTIGNSNKTFKSKKVCITANYIESNSFFGVRAKGLPIDIFNCLPNGNAIAAISVGCISNSISSLQLFYNTMDNNGTSVSPIIGNNNISVSDITIIDLKAAHRVSFTSSKAPNTLRIRTYDENQNIKYDYQCGLGVLETQTIIVAVEDFIGLTNIFADETGVQAFEIAQYRA